MLNILQDPDTHKLIIMILFFLILGWQELSLYIDEKRNNKKGAK